MRADVLRAGRRSVPQSWETPFGDGYMRARALRASLGICRGQRYNGYVASEEVFAVGDTYDEAVRKLAAWHAEGVTPSVTVYAIPDPERREVRLIEVSDAFPETGIPAPVTIGPTPDFPYTSGTLSVTPTELHLIRSGELALPEGWDFTSGKKVWPSDGG